MFIKPTLAAEIPDTWTHRESITYTSPDGSANVIFSSEHAAPSLTTEEYARQQGEGLADFPDYVAGVFQKLGVFGSSDGWYRSFQWLPSESEPIQQHQLYLVRDGRSYVATATTTVRASQDLEPQLLAVLRGLVILDVQVP